MAIVGITLQIETDDGVMHTTATTPTKQGLAAAQGFIKSINTGRKVLDKALLKINKNPSKKVTSSKTKSPIKKKKLPKAKTQNENPTKKKKPTNTSHEKTDDNKKARKSVKRRANSEIGRDATILSDAKELLELAKKKKVKKT